MKLILLFVSVEGVPLDYNGSGTIQLKVPMAAKIETEMITETITNEMQKIRQPL